MCANTTTNSYCTIPYILIARFWKVPKEGYLLEPKSCTSENEKDNFLFYIRALCNK